MSNSINVKQMRVYVYLNLYDDVVDTWMIDCGAVAIAIYMNLYYICFILP